MNWRAFSVSSVIVLAACLLAFPGCLQLAWETMQDTTYYAPAYTEAKFRSIREEMLESDVIRVLGNPLKTEKATEYIEWIYGPSYLRIADDGGLFVSSSDPLAYTVVMADGRGTITSISGRYLDCNEHAFVGHSLAEMAAKFGKPLKVLQQPSRSMLTYSGTKVDGSYYIRKIGIDAEGKVNSIVATFYQD